MSRQGSQIGIGTDSQQQVPPRGIGLLASSIRGDYRSWGTKEGRNDRECFHMVRFTDGTPLRRPAL
jgi:hypothetical protein